MDKDVHRNKGLVRLIEKGKQTFHIAENINFYSEQDYKRAEKKFIKFCVIGRR